jgi:cytolysin (calcineurin-like family phosphatase)
VKGVNGPEHDPEQSLEFLKYDLTQSVGTSRHPVITFQHFAWLGGMSDWWHIEAKERFRDVIKPYNIACLINGHSHGASFIPWDDLLTIHDGSTARGEGDNGDFLVVRVTEKELIVIQRKLGEWGIHMRKPLAAAPPASK